LVQHVRGVNVTAGLVAFQEGFLAPGRGEVREITRPQYLQRMTLPPAAISQCICKYMAPSKLGKVQLVLTLERSPWVPFSNSRTG
jgi:hypothetical protein